MILLRYWIIIYQQLRLFFVRSVLISKEEREIREEVRKRSFDFTKRGTSSGTLLLPLMPGRGTMLTILSTASKISQERGFEVKYFYVHTPIDSELPTKGSRLGHSLRLFQLYNRFYLSKICRIYGLRSKDVVFTNFIKPLTLKENIYRKEKVLDINYHDVLIGDLIYDTYLRYRDKPTLNFDNDFWDIYSYGLTLSEKWDNFFKKNKIDFIVLPYCTYLHWGIPTRIALSYGIDVISYGSNQYILTSISQSYPFHTKNFHLYRSLFSNQENKNEKKAIAKELLTSRLQGKIDQGISYMEKSAFSENSDFSFDPPDTMKWCVIYLHCFFDSPHVFGSGLFCDFYEWTEYLLDKASRNKHIMYYVKPHPNGMAGNDDVLQQFERKFTNSLNISFLPKETSNKAILEKNPDAIFTFYGTVAHEFAACGVPVVLAGDNPHQQYQFIYQPDSLLEYDCFIDNVGEFGLPEKYSLDDIYEFFYMHYMYYTAEFDSSNASVDLDMVKGHANYPDIEIAQLIYE